MQIHGHVTPGFEAVRDAFELNFSQRGEVGASVSARQDGRVVVDLWAGTADPATDRPWEADTLATVFSSTKGLAALCMLMLHDRGLLDYDRPVAHYWPGFAQRGKESITVRTLLEHRSGLVAIDRPLDLDVLENREALCAALEAQEPSWEPGTAQGYHGVSFGPYISELFHRVAGVSLGQFLAEEVATPLGADAYLGLPDALEPRVASMLPIQTWDKLTGVAPAVLLGTSTEGRVFRAWMRKSTDTHRAFANPAALGPKGMANFNTRRFRAMGLAWCGAVCSARGLATIYGALARGGSLDGHRLVSPESIDKLRVISSWSDSDRVLHKPMGFTLGFLKDEAHILGVNPEVFGHPGSGGHLGIADPSRGLSMGYVMNKMDWRIRSPRAVALWRALDRCAPFARSCVASPSTRRL